MPPPLIGSYFDLALPPHCEPSTPWLATISSRLHICIPTPLALVSSLLGTLSIVSWLFAQLPQIYKNFVLQSTSGLSVFFLVEWLLGDTGNLVGAVLTRQAGWQVVIASYYVLVDVILVVQYFWYTHYKEWKSGLTALRQSKSGDGDNDILEGVSPSEENSPNEVMFPAVSQRAEPKDVIAGKRSPFNFMFGQSPSYSNEKLLTTSRQSSRTAGSGSILPVASPRTVVLTSLLCAVLVNASPTEAPLVIVSDSHAYIMSNATSMPRAEIVGRVASWLSTILYLCSRPPQLYKNYRRKSTTGLSPLLFMAAFSGNLFYSASLLTNPNGWFDFPPYGGGGWVDAHGNNRAEYIGRTVPFFLGAAGVLFLDALMGLQFLMYRSSTPQSSANCPEEEDIMSQTADEPKRGRSRWRRRVSGWMRGWIPSPPEDEPLLTAERSGRYGAIDRI